MRLHSILLLLLLPLCAAGHSFQRYSNNLKDPKNFVGNPHRKAMRPHVSPIVAEDMRVEPANWWTGMKHNTVQVLFHKKGIASMKVTTTAKTPGIKILKAERGDSDNYLFVTLSISAKAKPQNVPLAFYSPEKNMRFTHEYPILARNNKQKAVGVTSKDVVYLVFPDRFANGDPTNDNVAGMHQGLQRDSLLGRHGGDLQGVIDHLDYIQDLGITTIWLNPELENDQAIESYHGYAITDHYRVDRRFGTNEKLIELIDKCHARGIKVVRDVVLNHIGEKHYWMEDLPSKDWVNQWASMTRTNYRAPTLVDPYASQADRKLFNDGWFVAHMPDLNQRNPFLANYLIQQSIWWMEYAGFDDLRIDTYTYSDQAFCSRWCAEVLKEYPNLGMFGEIWEHGVAVQGFFADNQPMQRAGYDSNLPGVIDFQLLYAINEALTREQGWTEGACRIYYTLAQDHFYQDPMRNLIMLDNHDFPRFYTVVGENYSKYQSGMALLFTMRGIPQIYYMTEILGTGSDWPSHGNIRKEFPGGWPGDKVNKFLPAGRTEQEQAAHTYARALIRYRNTHPVLQTGKLMQFVPENSVYVYFRYNGTDNPVMVVINTANEERTIDTGRYAEMIQGRTNAVDVVTGKAIGDFKTLKIAKNSPLVLELR
jgi:neopullulanase